MIQSNILLTDVEILSYDYLFPIFPSVNTPPIINSDILLTDTDIPVFDNLISTSVSLDTNSPSNNDTLPTYETVVPITITPGSGSVFPEDITLLPKITSLTELLRYLSEVMIRFNNNPRYYMQDDFNILIKTISNSLINLYLNTPVSSGEVENLYITLESKVDKVTGWGLSKNNLTDELKNHYDQGYNDSHIHIDEFAIGDIDGDNTIFMSTYDYIENSVVVYINGLREFDFTESANKQITLSNAPLSTGTPDSVRITYLQQTN